ncbi:hypothetical protein [Herpetosiphon giganteus]|uniref:hypothetical protein n=1 Tax=Herpetosiphon giganteus TaxID=2029754 RepID=UPI00195B587A|nr:hypothetical protein [Herpetosiphon giganteus]MBM7846269.1 hypothetical protein [Herpetosiphon giganteus]
MARPTDRTYADQGIPGRVKQSISRTTGQPVTLYYAEQAGIEAEHSWVVVCETHGEQASYPTLRQAEQHIPLGDWCAACMAAPKRTPTVIAYGTPANPHKGRRTSRFVRVHGDRFLAFGKDVYDHLGNPDWIALQMKGNMVILLAAEEPEKHGQGIHKVKPSSHTGVVLTVKTFLAEHQIANGKYIPVLTGTTVRFVPERTTDQPAAGGTEDA